MRVALRLLKRKSERGVQAVTFPSNYCTWNVLAMGHISMETVLYYFGGNKSWRINTLISKQV